MKNVAVIGAGISGLAAATFLSRGMDCHIDIFESRGFVGGRMYSLLDETAEEYIDNGQHVMISAYSNYLEFLELIATAHMIDQKRNLKICYKFHDASSDIFDTARLPGKLGLAAALATMNKLSSADKFHAVSFLLKLRTGFIAYKEKTVSQMLAEQKHSQNLTAVFWEPLVLATLNQSCDKAPAALFAEVLKRAFLTGKDNFRFLLPETTLADLTSGFFDFAKNNNITLHLKKPVRKLVFDESRCNKIIFDDKHSVNPDFIISTLQPYQLMKILPKDVVEKHFGNLKNFGYSPIVSIYLWFDKNTFEEDFFASIGTKIQWVFNRRAFLKVKNSNSKYAGHITIIISNAHEFSSMPEREIISIVMKELRALCPETAAARLMHYRIIKERFATYAADINSEKQRYSAKTAINNFFLAGDWTDTGLPATLESAAQSGKMAAEKILDINITMK